VTVGILEIVLVSLLLLALLAFLIPAPERHVEQPHGPTA
jgi:hypothetical protein